MKYRHISLDTILRETIEDYALDGVELRESLLKRWGMDAVNMVPTTEQMTHQITHIVVQAGVAQLPENLNLIQSVLGRAETEPCSQTKRVERLSQWNVRTDDPDVELEVRIKCIKCKKKSCECSAPVMEVDVDRTWQMGNLQEYLRGWSTYGKWGEGGYTEDPLNSWTLLRPRTGHFSHRQHFLTDCPNLQAPEEAASFYLDLPYINTSFMEGELLVSFLGRKVDDNGDIMVPEQVDLIEAVKNHIMYKWFMLRYTRSIGAKTEASQQYLQAANLHLQSREQHFGLYRSQAEQPDPIEFRTFMREIWMQRLPDINYDNNLGVARKGDYAKYTDLFRN